MLRMDTGESLCIRPRLRTRANHNPGRVGQNPPGFAGIPHRKRGSAYSYHAGRAPAFPRTVFVFLSLTILPCPVVAQAAEKASTPGDLPANLQAVLDNAGPLSFPRAGQLPLFVLPISQSLAGIDDSRSEAVLRQLNRRGIGYTVKWNPEDFAGSVKEAIRIGTLQQRLGLEVAADATACLSSFFDGSESTLHEDDSGHPFAETSFGGKLGCPFALKHRYQFIRQRIESFLRAYEKAGIRVRFVFADWEIDGPIEWNDAWASSKRCRRCRENIPRIDNFREFQKRLREIRSEMQRVTFAQPVTASFPEALVGNYAVYPHDGYRYWYDYFEREAEGMPFRADQRARYREWAHEFEGIGYTFAMPVVYTWYRTFGWYDFDDLDYRWFYNMLLVGSNAGRHTPHNIPIIPFVHWTTTAPPKEPDPRVRQFSAEKYQELLWHLLLRGHDTFFLWCLPAELPREIRLMQEVYGAALAYRGFLERGEPIHFEVPSRPAPVVSGIRLGDKLLVRRTDFGAGAGEIVLQLAGGGRVVVPSGARNQVLNVEPQAVASGFLKSNGRTRFPIGFYELPKGEDDLKALAAAGVNLVRCHDSRDLDRAGAAGLMGWVPLNVQNGDTEGLRKQVAAVGAHPALAAWEGPDEVVWMFTAYSGLQKIAGFTRADWQHQRPKAVAYAGEQARQILPKLREGIRTVRGIDARKLPFWINEAADSDMKYVREYAGEIDVTGCDYYPVHSTGNDLPGVGRLVNRWHAVGRGKPVWMVLQAFSWHSIRPDRQKLYPTFVQSRFMAYDAIVHGARGLLYWGSWQADDPAFRRSLYALTSELAALEPFLIGIAHEKAAACVVDDTSDPPGLGVRAALRQHDRQFVLILVNEDEHHHLGVDIRGLEMLEGRQLDLLYGSDSAHVTDGGFVTRLQGHEVKVFATDARLDSGPSEGRQYGDAAASAAVR